MIWSVIQQVGGQAATMVVFFVLAALLPPRDFGLVGMAGAWLAVLNAFCETGFGAALIQRDHLREEHLSSTFGVNVLVGVALTVLGIALSWPAAIYFRTPALQPVMAALSLGFLVRAFGLTQAALVQRELRFRALAIRDMAASVVGGAMGIALALAGYGVWSLVAMTLVGAVLETILLWRLADWRPKEFGISRHAAAELWPYSSKMLGFSLFKALAQNTDRLVIGPLLGVQALGLYTLAYRAVIYPVTTFVGAVGAYLFPKVARLQSDRHAVGAVYRAVLVGVLNLVLPALVAMAILAPAIIPLLGPRWHEAIPIIQILTIAGIAQALMAPVGQIMKGLGRPGWLIWWSVGLTVLTSVALWLGTRWDLRGATVAYAIAHLAALPAILLIGRRLTGLGMVELLNVSWRPIVATTFLAGALVLLSRFTSQWSPWVSLASALLIGLPYLFVAGHVNPEFRGLVAREIRKLRVVREESAAVARPARRG
ncbi:MAG: lipopolysaccharide biosynthesis protein [Gemmatimonadales bacterium]